MIGWLLAGFLACRATHEHREPEAERCVQCGANVRVVGGVHHARGWLCIPHHNAVEMARLGLKEPPPLVVHNPAAIKDIRIEP